METEPDARLDVLLKFTQDVLSMFVELKKEEEITKRKREEGLARREEEITKRKWMEEETKRMKEEEETKRLKLRMKLERRQLMDDDEDPPQSLFVSSPPTNEWNIFISQIRFSRGRNSHFDVFSHHHYDTPVKPLQRFILCLRDNEIQHTTSYLYLSTDTRSKMENVYQKKRKQAGNKK